MQDAKLELLRKSFSEACAQNVYDEAHDILGKIQARKKFPLFLPKTVQAISPDEIDEYVDLLYPLMNLYFYHKKIDELFKCASALVDWLEKRPYENWVDEHYRLSSVAHQRMIVFYETQNDERAIQAACKIVIRQGIGIKIKTPDDWRVLIMAHRRLSLSYLNQHPQNIKRADHYRGELLKCLWENFDHTKKSFVEICYLVDEISDADDLRKTDADIDEILKQYLLFAHTHPAKSEPFVTTHDWETLVKLFLQACEKKLWENAEFFFTKMVTEHLKIDLASPYEAVDQSDAKITRLLEMLTHLGMRCWENNEKDKAIPFLQKAGLFILVMRHVRDELWRHSAVSAYLCALSYSAKDNLLDTIKACKRSLSMFECIREKNSEDRDCIVKAQGTLAKMLKPSRPKALPPKPPVSLKLADQRILFDVAFEHGDREAATRYLINVGNCLSVDIFSPLEVVDLSEENLRDIIDRLNLLSQLKGEEDNTLHITLMMRVWWNKLQQKSPDDWQFYLSLLREISTLYFAQNNFAECVSTVTDILKAHENIKKQEEELDITLLMESCDLAAGCCSEMDNEEGSRAWSHKADHYRSVLVTKIKADVEEHLASCKRSVQHRDWDFVQSSVCDAEGSLERLRELVSGVVVQPDPTLEDYIEARSDETELLRIESNIQMDALIFKNKKKCTLQRALMLARNTMSENDKQMKIDIEARKKAKEDAEKAERKRQNLEALHERERKREEERLKAAEKEAAERKQAERNKQFEIEKAKFVGFYRKFNKLSLEEIEVFYLYHRKLSSKIMNVSNKHYAEGCAHDLARQKLILACEEVMEACDVILSCYLKSQLTDYKDVSYEELLQLNPVFVRAWNLYSKSAEWERLEQAVEVCTKKLEGLYVEPMRFFRHRLKHNIVQWCEAIPPTTPKTATVVEFVSESPVIPIIYFFPIKDKTKNGLHNGCIENLMQLCESALNDLVQYRQSNQLENFSVAEKRLEAIWEELYERYPGFEDILDDDTHELYEIMSILESSCENFGKINRVVDTMPSSERVKEICGKLHNRIVEVERLRKSCTL